MKAVLPILLAVSVCAPAQTDVTTRITRVVRVHSDDASKIATLAGRGAPDLYIDADNTLHTIVVKGLPGAVSTCEQTIKELDLPAYEPKSSDIEITVYIIGAATKANALPSSPIPQDLLPVLKQLRSVFPYSDYEVAASMLLRSAGGRSANNQGVMKNISEPGHEVFPYIVKFLRTETREGSGGPSVHLENFFFHSKAPGQLDVDLGTDVDLKEGQKVVVGKANIDANDTALFIVLSAKIIN